MGDFRRLAVWRKSHALALAVYRITEGFPPHEVYSLTSQIRRAATSVPANIAEGCGRNGDRELARFLTVAIGSANELDYHLLLAKDLTFIDESAHAQLAAQVGEVKRMLAGLITRVRRRATPPPIADS